MLRRHHTSDKGASTIEYVAIVVLVATLVAGLLALNLPRLISDGFNNATELVLGEEGTEAGSSDEQDQKNQTGDPPPADAPGHQPETEPIPLGAEEEIGNAFWDGNGGTPREASDFLTGDQPLFGFEDRGNYDWDCGYLLDGFCKFGGGISQGTDEAWDDLKGTGCLAAHLCSHEEYKENWRETKEGVDRLKEDPGGALGDMWDGLIDPFKTNEENNGDIGGFFKNLGYSVTQVAGGPLKIFRPFGGDSTPDGNGRDGDRDGSNCSPNSFPPGVLVLLADGTAVPIEEVSVGDRVLAADPYTGEQAVSEVTHLIFGQGEKTLTEISVDDGSGQTASVTATSDHPFWVPAQGWTDAADLEPGTWLHTSAGTWVQVSAVESRTVPDQNVHNLTVEDLHTYHVLAGQTPLLVHNSGPCDPGELASSIDVEDLGMTKTVEDHFNDITRKGTPARPFMNSTLVVREIMNGSTPRLDPRGTPGAVRWDTPGELNGRPGTWELVVDTNTNTILHFNFVR